MATQAEEKLVRLVTNIVEQNSDEINDTCLQRDAKLCSLKKDLKKATAENRYLSCAIIKKQMLARIQQLSNEYAARKMQMWINSGQLGNYLEEEDRKRFEELRLKMYLVYDGLDYVLADMSSFFRSIGFADAELSVLRAVENARASISGWAQESTNIKGSCAEEIIDTEGERVYKYVCRRFPYAEKQIQRAYENQNKTTNK